jgi:signal transduction histidine kinase
MLTEHADDLEAFLRDDPRGQKLLPYLGKLATQLVAERERMLRELGNLTTGVDHVKNVVRTQQAYAKAGGLTERCRLADLVDDALRLEATSLENHRIEVVRDDVGPGYVSVDKHKTLQILVNLLTNAKQAVNRRGRGTGCITVRSAIDEGRARIEVVDDGVGITEENLGKIFGYGFTTSRDGHGFGLHNSANAANEMGGALRCHSDGEGKGATFTLELPVAVARDKAA